MKSIYILFLSIVIFLMCSCAANKPYIRSAQDVENLSKTIEDDQIDYELYLVGDIGARSNNAAQSDIVELIKSELASSDRERSIVFLGNSFSENKFPDSDTDEFRAMDKATTKCIKELKDEAEKIYFIPGNAEWYDGKNYTVSALNDVEDYVQSKVKDKNIFVPSNGCGEPKVVKLTDDLLLVLIDSQWVLQGNRSDERKKSGCEIDSEEELVIELNDILSSNKNKNVIIAAHHPVYSNGNTGGNYKPASHLLPLPILGSMITGIRKIGVGQQKFGHPQYEAYRAVINSALGNFEGIIHASAHDRNLQYHNQDDNHFIVAGSGTKTDFVRKGGTADFALMSKGFSKITHTKGLELWLEFFVPDEANPKVAKSIYKKRLYKKEIIDYTDKSIYKDISELPKTIVTKASDKYKRGKIGMGKTYRKSWGADVEVPLLILDETHGGLKPVKQGGGFQTKSLRLENKKGQQWVLRSVDKDVVKVVPPALRKTFIRDIMQDGISSAHPYGAEVVPPFAEALGIYHANPKFVWLPAQKALGDYNIEFSERLYLFEERPGGNMEGHPNYGGATESINTPELIENLFKSHKHKIDDDYVLKARLLDIWMGDWDRHDDQWRWAIFEDDNDPEKVLYRAVPRDRDQVFFKNDGFLQYIASRPYISPGLRKFEDQIDFIDGVSFNARHFDRHFLSQLNKESYIKNAKLLQEVMTDELIDYALNKWPKAIYALDGKSIEAKLKSRRRDMVKYAEEFYNYLTKEVTAVGTYGKNTFEVVSLPGDQLDVKVYHHNKKDKQHLIWSRIIEGKDCNELRLYGLKGGDTFNFSGTQTSSIKVYLVGGSGKDEVNNESNLNIIAHDRPQGMSLNGNKVRAKIKDEVGINRYDRKDWKLDRKISFPLLTFYTDEGLGINYNLFWIENGFRKNPYKSSHTLNLSYFWGNKAIVGNYGGHWTSVFGPDWDFRLDAAFAGPTFTQFFYGLGNAYNNYEEILPNVEGSGSPAFHIVRGSHLDINPQLVKNLGNNKNIRINPSFEFFNIDNILNDPNEPRFIFLDEAGRSASDFDKSIYASIGFHYESNRVNSPSLPTRGYVFSVGTDYKQSLTDSKYSNITFESNVAAYIPFSPTHKVVLATNLGGAYTLGDYEFFHANYLASQSRMRGYITNRFAGDGIIYHATDLRIKLLQGKGGLRTGVGIFGSFDYGRAFLEDENINDWHISYGGGLFLTPLDILGFKIGYYVGDDDVQLSIGGVMSY